MFARDRLLQLTEGMKGRRIVVYGDIVADRFIYGTPKRISREAPVLILRQYRDDVLLGGGRQRHQQHSLPRRRADSGLGSRPRHAGTAARRSDDGARYRLQRRCSRGDRYNTPTKVRILGGMPHATRQQIVRYDIEDHCDLTRREAAQFGGALREQMASAHAALISDYGYGAVTQPLAAKLTGCRDGKAGHARFALRPAAISRRHRRDAERRGSGEGRGHSLFNGDDGVKSAVARDAAAELDCERC